LHSVNARRLVGERQRPVGIAQEPLRPGVISPASRADVDTLPHTVRLMPFRIERHSCPMQMPIRQTESALIDPDQTEEEICVEEKRRVALCVSELEELARPAGSRFILGLHERQLALAPQHRKPLIGVAYMSAELFGARVRLPDLTGRIAFGGDDHGAKSGAELQLLTASLGLLQVWQKARGWSHWSPPPGPGVPGSGFVQDSPDFTAHVCGPSTGRPSNRGRVDDLVLLEEVADALRRKILDLCPDHLISRRALRSVLLVEQYQFRDPADIPRWGTLPVGLELGDPQQAAVAALNCL